MLIIAGTKKYRVDERTKTVSTLDGVPISDPNIMWVLLETLNRENKELRERVHEYRRRT